VATKQQLLNKAKKANVEVEIEFGDGYVVVMMDAWDQQWSGYEDGHGFSASGDTASEAYADALMQLSTLVPCNGCGDKYHR
jgi:hypothetical protein